MAFDKEKPILKLDVSLNCFCTHKKCQHISLHRASK